MRVGDSILVKQRFIEGDYVGNKVIDVSDAACEVKETAIGDTYATGASRTRVGGGAGVDTRAQVGDRVGSWSSNSWC